MVQNSTAIDISKIERQASGERRRSEDSHSLNTLLQDILCFFILLSLGLLIVASILCVALNIHQTATYQQSQRSKPGNISRLMLLADGVPMQERLSLQQGPIWIRFFHCLKQYQQPEHDAKLEQIREENLVHTEQLKEQDKQQLHFDHSELAKGHFAEAQATIKKSDSVPQAFSVDNL